MSTQISTSHFPNPPTAPRLPTVPNEIKLQIFQHVITSSLPPNGDTVTISPPPTTGLEVKPISKGLSTILRLSRSWSSVIHKLIYGSVVFHLSGRAMKRELNRAASYTRLNLLSHWSFSPYIRHHIKHLVIALDDGYWASADRKLRRTLKRFPELRKVVFTVPPYPWKWWVELYYVCVVMLDFVECIEVDVAPDAHLEGIHAVLKGRLEKRNHRFVMDTADSSSHHPA